MQWRVARRRETDRRKPSRKSAPRSVHSRSTRGTAGTVPRRSCQIVIEIDLGGGEGGLLLGEVVAVSSFLETCGKLVAQAGLWGEFAKVRELVDKAW